MLTEVMRDCSLARPPVDTGFCETDHHAQISRDAGADILGGRLVVLTAVIRSGKPVPSSIRQAQLRQFRKYPSPFSSSALNKLQRSRPGAGRVLPMS
jgi:hypothetical protein